MIEPSPLSVSELTARIKQMLEAGFGRLEVIGEVSRLTLHASGHAYFSVKDAGAVISAVIWKSSWLRLAVHPDEGRQYVFTGHISVYEPRGAYQLIVTGVREAGEGQLAAELERRKRIFAERGYFDLARKQPVPALPNRIAIITSESAAALEDVKKVLDTRPSWLELHLSPAPVQGAAAAPGIAEAFRRLDALAQPLQPDVILLVRGGGSLEDLWCFNEEIVVKAIADCTIPVISGIGHEIDTTLADLAADLRAATPSNAAELACPDRDTLRSRIPRLAALRQLLQRHLDHGMDRIQQSTQRLSQSMRLGQDRRHMSVERAFSALHATYVHTIKLHRRELERSRKRLMHQQPRAQLMGRMRRLGKVKHRLFEYQARRLQTLQSRFTATLQAVATASWRQHDRLSAGLTSRMAELEALSPYAVLRRGYAITTDQTGHIIKRLVRLRVEDRINIRFHDGTAGASIESLHAADES